MKLNPEIQEIAIAQRCYGTENSVISFLTEMANLECRKNPEQKDVIMTKLQERKEYLNSIQSPYTSEPTEESSQKFGLITNTMTLFDGLTEAELCSLCDKDPSNYRKMKRKVPLTAKITYSAMNSKCMNPEYSYYVGKHGLKYFMEDVPEHVKRNPEFLRQLFVVYGTIDETEKWYIQLCTFFTKEQIVLAKECAQL